jgi:hypothetical protein
MRASNAEISNLAKPAKHDTFDRPVHETVVIFIERGKTDKSGWLGCFDELAEYLGRLS